MALNAVMKLNLFYLRILNPLAACHFWAVDGE